MRTTGKEMGFLLRSSHIFCVCDAPLSLSQLVKHTLKWRSVRAALERIARTRFARSMSTSPTTRSAISSLENLQENTVFRASGFLVETVPQMVKFCARNLLQTHITISIFLSVTDVEVNGDVPLSDIDDEVNSEEKFGVIVFDRTVLGLCALQILLL